MKLTRRKLFESSAAIAVAELMPREAEAWIHGSYTPPSTFQLGQRPFAASSPGNTPLPNNPILSKLPWPAFDGGNYFVIVKVPLDIPDVTTAPLCVVDAVNPGWQNPAGHLAARPMTSGFNTNYSDSDKEVCSLIGNDIFSYWLFCRTATDACVKGDAVTDPTAFCFAYGHTDIVSGSGFGTFFPNAVGVFATGQSCMMGTLFKEEATALLADGKNSFPHIINLCVFNSLLNGGTAYKPAIANDSTGTNGYIVEGQLMAIPAGTAMPAGLTTYGQMMFNTMLAGSSNCYGAFICDQGGSTQFYLGTSYNNPSGSWNAADLSGATNLFIDARLLIPLLAKVGYNLDGFLGVLAIAGVFAPQLQLAAYVGVAMHITRDSDSTGQDISFGAAPQSLLDTTSIASFCSGTTGRVATYKSQSGGHDFVSAGATAPIIYQSGALVTINSVAVMSFDGTGANYLKATGTSASFPNGSVYILVPVVQIPDYLANYCLVGPDTAGGLELRVDATTGLVRLLAQGGTTIGVTPYPIPLNSPVMISAFYNSDGSYSIWFNGIKIVQGTGTLVIVAASNIQIAAGPSGADAFKGQMGAALVCSNVGINARTNPQNIIEAYFKNLYGPFGTIVVPTTTFDPAHKSATITLSNGNLTAIDFSAGSNINAFGTVSKSAGLFYHELTIGGIAAHEFMGYANNSFSTSISQALGNDAGKNSVGWWSSGEVKIGGTTLTTIATYTTNSVLGMCIDFTHSKVWFGVIGASSVLWNNDILANQNPATNTGGISLSTLSAGALFPVVGLQSFNDQVTVNFGATAYRNATLLPAGFSNWQ